MHHIFITCAYRNIFILDQYSLLNLILRASKYLEMQTTIVIFVLEINETLFS